MPKTSLPLSLVAPTCPPKPFGEGGPVRHILRPEADIEAEEISTEQLTLIATGQKALIWNAAMWVIFGFIPPWPPFGGFITLTLWMAHLSGCIAAWRLASAMRKNPWVWGSVALVPLINVIAYAVLVTQAGKMLKNNGIKSGVFGVSRQGLKRMRT